ncbi:MAG: SurA N-terminal domain-containing protein [Candidatus Omnitrophota bacterium]
MSKLKVLISVLFVWGLTLFCHLAFGPVTQALALDKIIAIVNNEIITQKDLDDFCNYMRVQLSQQYKGKELEEKVQQMKPQLLQKLMDDSVVLQEAKKEKIKIEDARIKARLAETTAKYGSGKTFEEVLRRQGLVMADVEKRIRDQLLMYTVIETKVRQSIKVNPSEVTQYYQNNADKFILPEKRNLEVLSVKNLDQANLIYASLKDGKDIENVAKDNSLQIDHINAFKNGELKKDLEDAIFRLKTGEPTQPIKNVDTYYIFVLASIEPPKQQELSSAQEGIYEFLYEKKMQDKLAQWLEETKKRSYIKIL